MESRLRKKGFLLQDVSEDDLQDFIRIEKATHSKYVHEHSDFFGEYKEEIIVSGFQGRMKMTFFKKIMQREETVGFISYDRKEDKIELVYIRVLEKAQNNGIGTIFLTYLKELAQEYGVPVIMVAIKTNPAGELYKRLGFELMKEENVFYYFKYIAGRDYENNLALKEREYAKNRKNFTNYEQSFCQFIRAWNEK